MKISAVILTKNEEKNLEKCLKSLDFCDEKIIIDDFSTDKTISIAKKFNAKIYKRKLNDNFALQRNYGLSKVKFDWVLFLDADEIIDFELKKEISRVLHKDHNYNAFYLKRKDIFWKKKLQFGELYNASHTGFIRLIKKNKGSWFGNIHEVYFVNEGKVGSLDGYIIHEAHDSVESFLRKINHYSTIRSNELFSKQITTNAFEIICFPFGKFIFNYFIKLGFLDGPEGFIYCFLMSFHSFLVRAKLFAKQK